MIYGKAWFNPVDQWGITEAYYTYQEIHLQMLPRATSPIKRHVSYTYMPQPTTRIHNITGSYAEYLAFGLNNMQVISSGNACSFSL